MLDKKETVGKWTKPWLDNNFPTETDIIYVSANPQTERVSDRFSNHIPLYETKWDDNVETVYPEDVTEEVISQRKVSSKRIIAHYLQPHIPFVGEIVMSYKGGWIFDALKAGAIGTEYFKEAYSSNLKRVMYSIKNNLYNLDGKTIITADHGYLFGEYGEYAHPRHEYYKEVVEIPWFEVDMDKIKKTKKEKQEKEIKDKLRSLGYE